MTIAQSLLPEFDMEMANTRRMLERVPDSLLDWRPHDKSGTMRWTVSHLATLPGWLPGILAGDSMDIAPAGGESYKSPSFESTAAAVAAFDEGVAAARAALSEADDANMMGTWSLLKAGEVMFSMPRVAVLRGFVLSHSIHHRAQLGVYLRLKDVPLPATYGPSADEGAF